MCSAIIKRVRLNGKIRDTLLSNLNKAISVRHIDIKRVTNKRQQIKTTWIDNRTLM